MTNKYFKYNAAFEKTHQLNQYRQPDFDATKYPTVIRMQAIYDNLAQAKHPLNLYDVLFDMFDTTTSKLNGYLMPNMAGNFATDKLATKCSQALVEEIHNHGFVIIKPYDFFGTNAWFNHVCPTVDNEIKITEKFKELQRNYHKFAKGSPQQKQARQKMSKYAKLQYMYKQYRQTQLPIIGYAYKNKQLHTLNEKALLMIIGDYIHTMENYLYTWVS